MVKEKGRDKRILKEVFPVTKRFIYIHKHTWKYIYEDITYMYTEQTDTHSHTHDGLLQSQALNMVTFSVAKQKCFIFY